MPRAGARRRTRAPRRTAGSAHLRSAPSATRRRRRKSRAPARLVALFVLLVVMFAGLGVRLVVLQVLDVSEYRALAAELRQREFVFPAHRGAILDRGGAPLAQSVEFKTLFADPAHVVNLDATAKALAPLLPMGEKTIRKRLRGTFPGDRFEILLRQADPKVVKKIERLELAGIATYVEPKRIYPGDRLASHVLGFVNADGDALGGVELQYDEILNGRPGRMTLEQDPSGRPLPQAEFRYRQAVPGRSLFLTIDKDLQYFTQRALRDAVRSFSADAASAIVLRPRTGEILALANVPDFDPNEFFRFADDQRRNRALTDVYEPGSAFKVVPVAAALDERVVKPRSELVVPDELQVADRVIGDSHSHPTENMTVRRIIEQSSNVGTVRVGLELGAERIDEWVRRFGFGKRTGLDFPGEAQGIVLDLDDWSGSTIGTVPIGQGIAVTPIQMTTAFAAIANDGVWVEPRIVHSILGPDGEAEPSARPARRKVIRPRTAQRMRAILTGVVEAGTGIEAQVPGYRVAGKTGTAQKPLPSGGYGNSYNASFAGMAPADDPEIVVLVTLDEPRPIWGGSTAAPTFRAIAEFALRHLGVPPSRNAERAARQIEESQEGGPAVRD